MEHTFSLPPYRLGDYYSLRCSFHILGSKCVLCARGSDTCLLLHKLLCRLGYLMAVAVHGIIWQGIHHGSISMVEPGSNALLSCLLVLTR